MELYLLDEEFNIVYVIDEYESFIWTDRYNLCGDFELYTTIDQTLLKYLKPDRFIISSHSDHVMIIESLSFEHDSESGNHLTVTGRSLESILDRRIVSKVTTIKDTLQNGIQKLLNENAISPSDEKRKLNLIFKPSEDPYITELNLDAQYHGDTLYTIITDLCEKNKIGFYIYLTDENVFEMSLYRGVDRSYKQDENPYVVFSQAFDNLISSNYTLNLETLKNVAYVAGEGDGSDRKVSAVDPSESSGMNRREVFVDAGDISKTDGETTISDAEYLKLLKQRGEEELTEYKKVDTFEGECDTVAPFEYGVDFYLGDIVSVRNEYGIENSARIIEIVRSVSTSEVVTYPTLDAVEGSITVDPILPSGYKEVEYLEATGTQWIDTGYIPNSNTRITFDASTSSTESAFVMGVGDASSDLRYAIYSNTSTHRHDHGSLYNKSVSVSAVEFVSFDKNKNVLTVGGTSTSYTQTDFVCPRTLYLFSRHAESGMDYPFTGKMKNIKIYDNDVLVRDFIACVNSAGKPGLYDIVGKKFYGNLGTGDFIPGPEIL